MPVPGYTLEKQTLFFREEEHTPAITEPQLSDKSRFLKSSGARTPCADSGGSSFPPRPHHSGLFKELWLQSIWRGNTCSFFLSSLPHLQCVPWQQTVTLQVMKRENRGALSPAQCFPPSPLRSLPPAGRQLEQREAPSPVWVLP